MLPTLQYRPWTRRHMAAMLFATAVPLAIGLSASGQQNTASELNPTSRIDDAKRATLTGIVTDLADKPIADAKVRVVIPSTDLRFDVDATAHREVWGKTDASGNYSIDISGIEQETVASIDILHREHRRLVGTLTRGGYPNDVTLSPGGRAEFNATLPESLYFAGQVVDEAGMPIEGILVGSSLRTPKSDAGIERSKTDAEGHFAVYSYEAAFLKGDTPLGDKTAVLWFQHDRYIDADIEKLEDLDPSKRDTLRVVMRAGYSISGTVNGADGTPASDVAISITQKEPDQRKAVRTDEQGQFRFDGINGGSAHLRVVDVVGNKKSIQTLDVDASRTEMIVSLVPFETAVTTTRQVLGMTLTDLTDAIDEAFDLGYATDKGVMVVEPGNQSEGFEIGEVRPGDVFWMVGNDRVASLRAMVNQLVKEARSPTIPRGAPGNLSAYVENDGNARVRVVYGFDDDRGHGSNTQYLKLTQQDIAELEELLESLESADRI